MARTERSADIAKPPEEVFPYLFEPEQVPQWTTGLDGYERLDDGPLGAGSRFREQLEVSGQHIDAEIEVTALRPARAAPRRRSEIRGIDVISTYALEPARRRHPPHPDRRGDGRRAQGPGPDPGHPAPPRAQARGRPRRPEGPPGLNAGVASACARRERVGIMRARLVVASGLATVLATGSTALAAPPWSPPRDISAPASPDHSAAIDFGADGVALLSWTDQSRPPGGAVPRPP